MKKKQNKKNTSKKTSSCKNGFSLIEVLITLVVLSVGILTVSALMAANIKSSTNAKNQIIASELAQEGIELVKNLKDNNPTFIAGMGAGGSNYIIDRNSTFVTFEASKSSTLAQKKLNLDVSGFLVHSVGTATKFSRKVAVSPDAASEGVRVTSYVNWNVTNSFAPCNIGNKCVSVETVLPSL